MLKNTALFLLLVCNAMATGTLYYNTNTGQCITQTVDQSLCSSDNTYVSTAAISYPAAFSAYDKWDGSTIVPLDQSAMDTLGLEAQKASLYQMQTTRARAAFSASTAELFDLDVAIDFLQRQIAQAGGLPIPTALVPPPGTPEVVIYTGGPSSAVANTTTETLLSTNTPIAVAAGATYEITAAGPMSTLAIVGATLSIAAQVGGVDVIATTPVSLLGGLTSNGWTASAQISFPTATTARGDIQAQTYSGLGTAQTGLASTASTVAVSSGQQTAGLSVKWGAASTSNTITANHLTIKRLK